MKLTDLLAFDNIAIQCHNDPDADAIASGYGLLCYLQAQGKRARLVYGGANEIRKSNLVLMVDILKIPIEHVTGLDWEPELLLTVDCQYGEQNVEKFSYEAPAAVIDHHKVRKGDLPELKEIRDSYGACATVVWDMLEDAGFRVEENESLSTALYYGLFMDTNKMQELRHPKDRDLRDSLEFRGSRSILLQLQSRNLSMKELKIAGTALSGCNYFKEHKAAVAGVEPCDPNILGIISDMMIEVDDIDVAVAYCRQAGGVKFSVRSCGWEIQAQQLARYLADKIGNGGGHMRKAGGFLKNGLLGETQGDMGLHEFITSRLVSYFKEQDLIYLGSRDIPDLSGEPLYEKQRLPIGYVYARDLGYPANTELRVRMLEGDKIVTVRDDMVILIGVEAEVYTNDEAYFLSHNDLSDRPYEFHGEYAPPVREAVQAEIPDMAVGEVKSLEEAARVCVPKSSSCIRARQLVRRAKVLNEERQECMQGMPGDWLVAREENPKDIYIIKGHIFEKTYKKKV